MRRSKAARTLLGLLAGGFVELPALSVSEWATKHRRLSRESSARPGAWTAFPYQVEPMDAALQKDVAEVVLDWAAQTGKSEIINNTCGYFMHADPAPQLLVQPTVDLGEAYSKERIAPAIRDSKALRKLVKDPRSRDSGNTLRSKVYPGGNLAIIGANAPAGLAGRPRRVILLDEVDRYPDSAGTEGDPVALADKRAESFPNAVKIKTSTPTIKHFSKIEELIDGSDYQKWHVCCPKCSGEQVLMWDQVIFSFQDPDHPDDPAAKIIDTKRTYIECRHCKAHLNDEDRIAMVSGGKWKATKEFKGVRGYWLNGINTLFEAQNGFLNRLHQFAEEFLKAKRGGKETLKTWINTFLAETYEEEGSSIEPTELSKRAETYLDEVGPSGRPLLPDGVLLLGAAVDVQDNRLEVEVIGFGDAEESWGVQYHVIGIPPRTARAWIDLDTFLRRTWEHPSGAILSPAFVSIDTGHETELVYRFVKPRLGRRFYAVKGSSGGYGEPLVARAKKSGVRAVPLHMVGTNAAKELVYSNLRLTEPGPGYCHFPRAPKLGYSEEWFKQLTVEKCVTKYAAGKPYKAFAAPKGARNEALDIRCYAHAGLALLNPDWATLAEKLNVNDEPEEVEAPPPEPEPVDRDTPTFDLATGKIEPPPAPVEPAPNTYATSQPAPRQVVRLPRKNWATTW